jgi:galactose oxidase-like protein
MRIPPYSKNVLHIRLLAMVVMALTALLGVLNAMKKGSRLAKGPALIFALVISTWASAAALAQTPGTFTPTGSMSSPRAQPNWALLPNGKVLVAGGAILSPCCADLASAELYDPATGTFSPTGSMGMARSRATATLLPNGKVLVPGGWNGGSVNASADLYDPVLGIFLPTGSMGTARQNHTATLLSTGKVLIVGGRKHFQPI